MDEVDFWVSFGCAGCLVDVVAPEIATEIERWVYGEGCKVLVTEDWGLSVQLLSVRKRACHTNDLPLSDE